MSEKLFTTGRKKNTRGAFSVSCAGGAELVKRLRKLENGGEKAIKSTVSEFTSRAPAWVSKGIREHYGVDAAAIKDAAQRPKRGKTTIKVAGVTVDGATLEYSGRLLTPLHFKMSPKERPKGKKAYKIRATIIKGQRTALPSDTFLGRPKQEEKENGKASKKASKKESEGLTLPYQRKGPDRYPLEVIRTLSVPQMIDGRAHDTVYDLISENLGKRFQHHVSRAMK